VGELVRDKIPDLIRVSGRTPHVTTLTAGAYLTADALSPLIVHLIALPHHAQVAAPSWLSGICGQFEPGLLLRADRVLTMREQFGGQDESVAHLGRRGCNDPVIAHLVGCRGDRLTCRVGGTIMSLRLQMPRQ